MLGETAYQAGVTGDKSGDKPGQKAKTKGVTN
jgi:hypothetical protein